MRGVTISIFILCVAVFGGFMAAAGVNDALGVGMDTGLSDEAQEVNESLAGDDQELSERGGNTGLLGFSVYAAKQLGVLFVLIGSIQSVLVSWGFPPSLASGIELIARIIQALAGIWIARGLIGE